jgi:hypothetical protein
LRAPDQSEDVTSIDDRVAVGDYEFTLALDAEDERVPRKAQPAQRLSRESRIDDGDVKYVDVVSGVHEHGERCRESQSSRQCKCYSHGGLHDPDMERLQVSGEFLIVGA